MVVKVSFNRNSRTPLSSPPAHPLSQPRLGHMEVWGIFSDPDHGTKGGFQEPGLHDTPAGQDRDCLNPRAPWLPKFLSGPQGPGSFFSILSTEPLPKSYPVPLLVPLLRIIAQPPSVRQQVEEGGTGHSRCGWRRDGCCPMGPAWPGGH